MNKAEFIEQLAKKTNLPKVQSEAVLNAAIEIIEKAVAGGDEVKLVGFGTFDQTVRRSRNGRNPKTGTRLVIPESRVPRFRPGKEFKDKVGRP